MSTSEHLAQLGVTIEQAREFIINHVNQPSVIYAVSVQNAITANMLAEIYGGVTESDVINFFNTSGFDGSALTDNDDTPSVDKDEDTGDLPVIDKDEDIGDANLLQTAQSHSVTDSGYGTLPVKGDSPAVESGSYWPSTDLTYSFNRTKPADYDSYSEEVEGGGDIQGFIPFPEAAEVPVRASFDDIETFTSLKFTETETNGDIRFNAIQQEGDTDGYAFFPDGTPLGGDVFLNNAYTTEEQYQSGSSNYFTVVHETGHALGLEHTFEGDASLPPEQENTVHSVMSYTNHQIYSVEFFHDNGELLYKEVDSHCSTDYAYYDVLALQIAYGANTSYNTGNNTYEFNFQTTGHEVIWDAGGVDTIDASSATQVSRIDLREGHFSSIDIHDALIQTEKTVSEMNITDNETYFNIYSVYEELQNNNTLYTGENNLIISKGVWIENAISGAGDDTIQDNKIDNTINSGSGDDVIYLTEGGFDTVDAGSGEDKVIFAVSSDSVQTEEQSDGSYLVVGNSFAAELTGVETLEFTDTFIYLS